MTAAHPLQGVPDWGGYSSRSTTVPNHEGSDVCLTLPAGQQDTIHTGLCTKTPVTGGGEGGEGERRGREGVRERGGERGCGRGRVRRGGVNEREREGGRGEGRSE